ncbi:hypothetical protein [Chryseobacterium lathyri]|uniref:hypothetical protein n=1 Tax=Chryseobacterium lathyri TaxID=395933 RepID=UPI001CBCDF61|nr:hypothetical protein [Chryseobacterium lathyri]
MNKTDSLKQRTHEKLQSTINNIELINGLIRKYEAIDIKLLNELNNWLTIIIMANQLSLILSHFQALFTIAQ